MSNLNYVIADFYHPQFDAHRGASEYLSQEMENQSITIWIHTSSSAEWPFSKYDTSATPGRQSATQLCRAHPKDNTRNRERDSRSEAKHHDSSNVECVIEAIRNGVILSVQSLRKEPLRMHACHLRVITTFHEE